MTLVHQINEGCKDVISVSTELRIPETAKVPAGTTVKELFEMHMAAVRRSGHRGYEMAISYPARATGSAVATSLLAQVSLQSNLGTDRPPILVPGIDPIEKSRVYLLPATEPVGSHSSKVTYNGSTFRVNLYQLFKGLNLTPPIGHRDIYTLGVTSTPITIGDLTGYALVLDPANKVTEPIRVSEVTKMKRQAAAMERKARQEAERRTAMAKLEEATALMPKD